MGLQLGVNGIWDSFKFFMAGVGSGRKMLVELTLYIPYIIHAFDHHRYRSVDLGCSLTISLVFHPLQGLYGCVKFLPPYGLQETKCGSILANTAVSKILSVDTPISIFNPNSVSPLRTFKLQPVIRIRYTCSHRSPLALLTQPH
jgi:hypothetical protein